jgi:acyl phosphate:glycerol-3-phosphate acyltransferase
MPGIQDLDAMGVPLALAAACGYLLGALPFGYLVARSRGVNIFEVGSRSPGATNVRRVLGKGPGNLVFFLDALKGALAAGIPIALSTLYFSRTQSPNTGSMSAPDLADTLGYVGLGFALVGHSFSCFTRFRGGKGVATAAGGLLVLMPWVALISAALWVAVFYATRYVSLASMLAALSLPVLAILLRRGSIGIWVAALIALFVVIRHRANVRRLLTGTEKKFERRAPGDVHAEGKP